MSAFFLILNILNPGPDFHKTPVRCDLFNTHGNYFWMKNMTKIYFYHEEIKLKTENTFFGPGRNF